MFQLSDAQRKLLVRIQEKRTLPHSWLNAHEPRTVLSLERHGYVHYVYERFIKAGWELTSQGRTYLQR